MSESDSVPRREFARRLAVGTAGLAVGGHVAGSDDQPQPAEPKPDEPRGDDGPPFGPPPPPVLLVEFVRQRYPHEKLTVDVLEKIESDVRGNLFRGARLAKYAFTNADEPAFVFAAYRADG